MTQVFAIKHDFGDVIAGAMNGIGQSIAQTWLRERSSVGIPKDLLTLSPNLLLMAADAPPGDSPDILHVGRNTMAAHVVPASTDTSQYAPKQLFDDTFRSAVHGGYHSAISGEPTYETISCPLIRPDGSVVHLLYERLLLEWRLSSGISQLTSLVKPLEIHLLKGPANPTPNFENSQPSLDPGLLWQAPAPIEFLADALPKIHTQAGSASTSG